MELHHLRTLKSKAVIENNLPAYYDCLEEIFIAISFKLTKPQKKNINKKLKEVYELLNTTLEGSVGQRVQELNLKNAKNILKEVDMDLIDYMHKYKMIFPKIEVTGGLGNLAKRLGLGKSG